jgi:hypothetical protein
VNAVLRRAKSRHLGSFEADPADFSRDTPFLEIACRLDAGSLPLALLQLCCPASPLAVMAAVILVSGAVHQGPPARVGSSSPVSAAGSPTFSSATKQPASGEGEKVGPSFTP